MQIQQIYNQHLSQFSYFISSGHEAVVIDPVRDIEPYLTKAAAQKVSIKLILETHIHADFVSGHLELADQTGATIIYGPPAKPAYPIHAARHEELICFGPCSIKVLHTPGHTVESVCYVLNDENGKEVAVFTGDTLLVGDVGRPDLMSGNKSANELAEQLFYSINKVIKTLPDHLLVYPGHGAGSPCGKNIGAERFTTIGEQKKYNYALKHTTLSGFTQAITANLSVPPDYFFRVMSTNIIGCKPMHEVLRDNLRPLSAQQFFTASSKALILDTRPAAAFAKAHINNALNIGLDGLFLPWAGRLIEADHPLLLVTEPGYEKQTIKLLAQIGIENITGFLNGGMTSWLSAGFETSNIESVDASDFYFLYESNEYVWLDFRSASDYNQYHIKHSLNMPLESLIQNLSRFDKNKKYMLVCKGGYHSMIAASVLKRHGVEHIINLTGGIEAIKQLKSQQVQAVFS